MILPVVAAACSAVSFALSAGPEDGTSAAPRNAGALDAADGPSKSLRDRLRRLNRIAAPELAPGRTTIAVGRSERGRQIRLKAYGYPHPRRPEGPSDGGSRHRMVLVFGCIHGTECAATAMGRFTPSGCPPPGRIMFVPNLNPDGLALGTRLNGRGVDLNRNFPSEWKPIGSRGDPEYSGPRPFSERETRLAARIILALHPEITIWFHQQAEPLVRAWGPSIPMAKRYARLSGLPFHNLPWLPGTAPNWQNHHFRGTTSFVVELPPGPLSAAAAGRQEAAVAGLSR
jgi:murein peptide amidase A